MLKNYPDVLNIHDLCEILRIGKKTAYKLLHEGKSPAGKSDEPTASQNLKLSDIFWKIMLKITRHNVYNDIENELCTLAFRKEDVH